MKTNIFKQARPLWIGIILWLPLIGGCTETELNESDTVPIAQIAEDTGYTSLPLIGTQWKLIGFVDSRAETIKLAEPLMCSRCYRLIFKEDGEMSGFSYGNKTIGLYELFEGANKLAIPFFQVATYAGEHGDGPYFLKSMKTVSSYDISPKGLALHYEEQKYMLFEPVE